jgi:hypothetical protein
MSCLLSFKKEGENERRTKERRKEEGNRKIRRQERETFNL